MKSNIRRKGLLVIPLALCFGLGFGIGKVTSCDMPKPVSGQVEGVGYILPEFPSIKDLAKPVEPKTEVIPEPEYITLSNVTLTAYCCENYPHICNNGDSTYTATGTITTPGRTIAVDPTVIPYGSEVIINGHTYIAEDCGGGVKGTKIDICFATHQEALSFGVQYADVKIRVA